MKTDIATRADIEKLVDTFYINVKKDEMIGYYFTDVVQLSWEVHIPVMYSFWDTVLLGNISYKGNPVQRHIELNRKEPLTEAYFNQWLLLWKNTIDCLFEGPVAEQAKQKAILMKTLMLSKIAASNEPGFIQ